MARKHQSSVHGDQREKGQTDKIGDSQNMPVGDVQHILLEAIVPNPHQPRREFSDEEIEDLAASIARVGLLQPPVVRKKECESGLGHYELVAGERRVRACRKLGYTSIPAYVHYSHTSTEAWQAESALIENIQRVDLNPIETALAIEHLMKMEGLTQEEVAVKVGKKRSSISNYIRLLKLPEDIQDHIRRGRISFAHAKVLLSCPEAYHIKTLAHHIIQGNWPVKRCEEYVRSLILGDEARSSVDTKPVQRDLFFSHIACGLEYIFGSKVEIVGSSHKGKVVIHYGSNDHLEELLEKWGYSADI